MKSPRNILRYVGLTFAALLLSGGVQSAFGDALTGGTAITDAAALRELDLPQATTGFSLRRMLDPGGSANANLPNDELFAFPMMLPVRQAIDRDIDAYAVRHRTELSDQSRDADNRNDLQLFDRDWLYSARTRFALAGIVNRMDRAFVSPQTCGEIRLIYRLVRTEPRADEPVRLPMTLNVVLAAANPIDTVTSRNTACAEVARRWLAMQDEAPTGAALVRRLTEADGPLVASAVATDPDRTEFAGRASAEVGNASLPNRLSDEGFPVRSGSPKVRRGAARKPDRPRSYSCRRESQSRTR
jgi:hypothetical protein